MKNRKPLKSSVAFRLSFRFMILVAAIIVSLSYGFVFVLRLNSRITQKIQLQKNAALIIENLQNDVSPALLGLPYFLTYSVFDVTNNELKHTNDPLLPILKSTGGNVKRYYQKNFYADGDLNVLYLSTPIDINNSSFIVQTSIDIDRDYTLALVRQIPQAFVIILIPIALISFFISLYISKRTIRPVKEITDAAQKMSSTNLENLLPVSNHQDELDKLAETFNQLFANLRKDFDQERNFTSNVSHELKTPVAGILGQANLLKRWGKEDPKQLEQSLDLIISEANSMNYIISNLLQINKLENNQETIFKETLNIQSMFHRLKNEFSITPNLQIIYDSNKDITFSTDIELLHQVLTSIISNSIKFFNKNIEPENQLQTCIIQLEVQKNNDVVILTITDNGPGFLKDVLPHIFERFYRGDKAHSRNVGGAGLGLSISQSIVKALGGTIEAKNKADVSASQNEINTGAVMIITLPCN